MFRSRLLAAQALGLAVAALLLAAPARAAEVVDKLLPNDTETVLSVNLKQILSSPLGKKIPRDKLEDAIKSQDEVNKHLQDLGFNPLDDLDNIVLAGASGNEPDKYLLIAHGKFDVKKFDTKAEEVAKDMKDVLKIHKVPDGQGGSTKLYEVTPPGQTDAMWVALANGSTMLASGGKDYVLDALEKEAGRKQTALKNKDLADLLKRLDTTQSIWVAVLGSTLSKNPQLNGNPDVKEVVDKISDATAAINIDKDFKVQVSVTAKTTDDAKDLDEKLKDGLNTALGAVALLAGQKKELAPLVDVLKNVKPDVKGKVVSVELQIAGKDIERAIEKNKD
jgi:hypothetical protein